MVRAEKALNELTCHDLIRRYIEARISHVSQPSTMRGHLKPIEDFFGGYTVEYVCQPGVMRELVRQYGLHRPTIQKTTIRQQLSKLSTVFQWATKEGVIDARPHIELGAVPKSRNRRLSASERIELLAAADAHPTPLHIRAYVHLALNIPIHMRQILQMTWRQVNFERGELHYWQGSEKRTLKLDKGLRAALECAFDKKKSNYIVEFRGQPVRDIYLAFQKLVERAGIKDLIQSDIRLSVLEQEPQTRSVLDKDSSHLFICYARRDGAKLADELCEALQARGKRCWLDREDFRAGPYMEAWARAIKTADALALILTPKANESRNVSREVLLAANHDVPILAIIIDETKPSDALEMFVTHDQFTHWKTDAGTTARAVLKLLDTE